MSEGGTYPTLSGGHKWLSLTTTFPSWRCDLCDWTTVNRAEVGTCAPHASADSARSGKP